MKIITYVANDKGEIKEIFGRTVSETHNDRLADGPYILDNRTYSRSYVGSHEKFVAEAGFLDACSCLYDKVCWSVGRSVPTLLICMSEGLIFVEGLFLMMTAS